MAKHPFTCLNLTNCSLISHNQIEKCTKYAVEDARSWSWHNVTIDDP